MYVPVYSVTILHYIFMFNGQTYINTTDCGNKYTDMELNFNITCYDKVGLLSVVDTNGITYCNNGKQLLGIKVGATINIDCFTQMYSSYKFIFDGCTNGKIEGDMICY